VAVVDLQLQLSSRSPAARRTDDSGPDIVIFLRTAANVCGDVCNVYNLVAIAMNRSSAAASSAVLNFQKT